MTLMVKETPKKPTDKILVKGKVTVWQGEGEDKKILVEKAENHWVDAGLKSLISALLCGYVYSDSSGWWRMMAHSFAMYLGTDTVTATTHAMTALTSPIGTPPGTAPSATSGVDRTNPATGTWRTAFQGIWYAGTVSGTVGEMALYLRPWNNITVGWTFSTGHSQIYQPLAMVSRLSAADGDFGAFAIDTSKSLTVLWEIQVSFA